MDQLGFSKPGDIYLTRNTPEYNQTYGYWQHAAISNGWAVLEGQAEPGVVIMVKEDCFRKRNPERVLMRLSDYDESIGNQIARRAEAFVGTPYDIHFFNCVTMVDRAYQAVIGRHSLFAWFSPDSIWYSNLLKRVEYFKDYEHWTKPDDWYEGRLQ